jgi:hypothetical protein
MTVNSLFTVTSGSRVNGDLHASRAAGRAGARRVREPFCDFHLCQRHGAPPRIVVVHFDPAYGPEPAVTWLEVRSSGDSTSTAAVVLETLGQAAAVSGRPVRLYDHDPHGNIHSWEPANPTKLTRERLATIARPVGRHRTPAELSPAPGPVSDAWRLP